MRPDATIRPAAVRPTVCSVDRDRRGILLPKSQWPGSTERNRPTWRCRSGRSSRKDQRLHAILVRTSHSHAHGKRQPGDSCRTHCVRIVHLEGSGEVADRAQALRGGGTSSCCNLPRRHRVTSCGEREQLSEVNRQGGARAGTTDRRAMLSHARGHPPERLRADRFT